MVTPLLEVVVAVTKIKNIFITVLLFLVSIHSSFAQMMEKGKTKFKILFNFLHQNSDSGDQVFDNSKKEELNVVEPMIFIEHQITEDTAIDGHFVFDFWTAASDTKLDAQTGASGGEAIKSQARISGNLGAKREVNKWTLSSGVGFSSEYDYKSFNGKISAQRAFAQDNFYLGGTFQYYADSLRLFQDYSTPGNAIISDFLPRKIMSLSLSASQILTRQDVIQFDLTYVQAKKNLESTASSVKINNVRFPEVMPSTRNRYAASSKWVHAFSDTLALHSSYRYYFDGWGIDAHTAKLSLFKEVNEDEDYVELSARVHNQTKVDFFKESFSNVETYMTSDSDLEDFTSTELSIFHSMRLNDKKFFGIQFFDLTWNNGITYYKRSNDLFYTYYQTSIGLFF